MVEEIHMLELRQAQRPLSEKLPHFSTSQEVHDIQTKRARNNNFQTDHEQSQLQKTTSVSYTNLGDNNQHVGSIGGGTSSNFCLALSLNQNNGHIDLAQPFPMNLCHNNFSFGTDGDQLSLKAGFDVERQNHHGKNF
ncbi:hypothetical protein COLO4_25538 [Corchorus olitorius]|uniref:Uncharacterized protein n=1 Tax=Corchorus olitorius TaxID=93759 RepID=A0A1R3I1Z1_9ROSI|nr:hypothetical protein COLO4_25538 [Corchorus olitorius]